MKDTPRTNPPRITLGWAHTNVQVHERTQTVRTLGSLFPIISGEMPKLLRTLAFLILWPMNKCFGPGSILTAGWRASNLGQLPSFRRNVQGLNLVYRCSATNSNIEPRIYKTRRVLCIRGRWQWNWGFPLLSALGVLQCSELATSLSPELWPELKKQDMEQHSISMTACSSANGHHRSLRVSRRNSLTSKQRIL